MRKYLKCMPEMRLKNPHQHDCSRTITALMLVHGMLYVPLGLKKRAPSESSSRTTRGVLQYCQTIRIRQTTVMHPPRVERIPIMIVDTSPSSAVTSISTPTPRKRRLRKTKLQTVRPNKNQQTDAFVKIWDEESAPFGRNGAPWMPDRSTSTATFIGLEQRASLRASRWTIRARSPLSANEGSLQGLKADACSGLVPVPNRSP